MKLWQNKARNLLRKSCRSTTAQKQAQPFKNVSGRFLPSLLFKTNQQQKMQTTKQNNNSNNKPMAEVTQYISACYIFL